MIASFVVCAPCEYAGAMVMVQEHFGGRDIGWDVMGDSRLRHQCCRTCWLLWMDLLEADLSGEL